MSIENKLFKIKCYDYLYEVENILGSIDFDSHQNFKFKYKYLISKVLTHI